MRIVRNQSKSSRSLLRSVCILLLVGSSSAVSAYGQTAQDKSLAFAAIKVMWESLPGLDRDADNAELLAFVRTRPEFSDSGIASGASCVWARFNDGRTLVLANNKEMEPPTPDVPPEAQVPNTSAPIVPSTPSADSVPLAATPIELPQFRNARLISTIRGWSTAVPNIRPWLINAGYEVPHDPGTLASLRTVAGDGLLYIEAHGGGAPFGVWTADAWDFTEDTIPELRDDLNSGRVIYMGGKERDPITRDVFVAINYAITDKFVTQYWSFGANSLVYLTVCHSDDADAADFKKAVLDKGASVYAGWTATVGSHVGLDTARLVFDRLMGRNDPDTFPEAGFKQRPFDWVSIGGDPLQSDLNLHGLGIDLRRGALLSFTPNPTAGLGDFGLLAPSILFGSLFEVDTPFPSITAGTLQIAGTFGSDPRPDPDSKVTVGGSDCPVKPDGWQPDLISCDLPSGAAGDVVVTVRKHDSNKARLTKWDGTFRYAIDGDDTLKATITYHALFRADIRKSRSGVHFPPIGPFFVIAELTDESAASYACSGSAVRTEAGTTTTITWTGAGNVPTSRVLPPAANSFQMGLIGIPGPNVQVTTDHGRGPGCDWTVVRVTPDGTFTETGHWDLRGPDFDIGPMPIEPTDPSFPGGSRSNFPFCRAPQTFTPARCRLDWDPISATFRPDPDSAR